MMWRSIGQCATGTSHAVSAKACEDALHYTVVQDTDGNEVLLCCASDGAGSALYAGWAAHYAVQRTVAGLAGVVASGEEMGEAAIYAIAEAVYAGLSAEAEDRQVPLNEFSCTLLGCCLTGNSSVFFQVGDGAIVRNDGAGFYSPVWWPQNGEYQNSTTFLIDDASFRDLRIAVTGDRVDEVAVLTDGLQMLALNMESATVHQPFFNDMLRYVRIADTDEKLAVLNRKLAEYLDSDRINSRTDDDKTLFLASRLPS